MAGLLEPAVGLVISYSYLWKEEEERGVVEGGRIDRVPLSLQSTVPSQGGTSRSPLLHHSFPPQDPDVAVEIPLRVKRHLRLDSGKRVAATV